MDSWVIIVSQLCTMHFKCEWYISLKYFIWANGIRLETYPGITEFINSRFQKELNPLPSTRQCNASNEDNEKHNIREGGGKVNELKCGRKKNEKRKIILQIFAGFFKNISNKFIIDNIWHVIPETEQLGLEKIGNYKTHFLWLPTCLPIVD